MRGALSIFVLLCPGFLAALPTGPNTISGSAEFHVASPGVLEILVGDRVILNWQGFSIGESEGVCFIQPSAASCVLNRVVGEEASSILGGLQANGKVLLINPRGVVFGKGAQVDTGSLIASTLDLLDSDFLDQGAWHFEGGGGMVQNLGSVRTSEGDLIIIAPNVDNRGSLFASRGAVAVAAGADVLLSPNGTRQLFIKPVGGAFFDQRGAIRASLVEMQVDGNAYQMAFLHGGSIDALAVAEKNGEIYLSVPTGDVCIEGAMKAAAGRVELFGQRVALTDQALLDVSGNAGGGTVLIDGEMVFVSPTATILADARKSGDGGRVILWSDESTRMYGGVSAQGGALGGNGGFVEVSGRHRLDYQGVVSTLAPAGQAGTLLLDPLDLTIGAANAFVSGASPFAPTGGACAPGPGNATLSAATLTAALAGGNVIVQTTGTVGACLGDVIVSSAVVWATGNSLTINAANDIFVNNMVQQSGAVTGGVFLNATRNVTVSGAAIRTAVGSQNAATSVIAGGDVLVIGATGARTAQIGFFTGGSGTADGPISVSCRNLTVQGGTGSFSGAQIGHGAIHLNASFTINTAATATIGISATGNVLVRNGSPAGSNAYGIIGHAAPGVLSGSTIRGDISVVSGGNVRMDATFGGAVSPLSIGHSSPIPSTDNIGGIFIGDITIQAAGQIDCLSSNSGGGATVLIGHGGQFSGCDASAITGDLRICCGGNANLIAGTNGAVRVSNFSFTTMPGVPLITGDLDFAVGGNLFMQVNQTPGTSSSCFLGFFNSAANAASANINMNVSVCGSATLSAPNNSGNVIGIGIRTPNFTAGTDVNIAVQGNVTATNIDCALFIGNQAGDLNFGLGGTLTASMVGASTGAITAGPSGVTRVFAGGSILTTPSAGGGTTSLTIGRQTAFQSASVDVRAGGDITWPNTMAAGITALSIQAGHTFAAGEIWSGSGAQMTSIASQPTSFNLACGSCAAFVSASPAVIPTCGAFSVSAVLPATISFTTTGPLTFTGLCTACSGPVSSLVLGAGGDISFGGTVGALTIGPFNTVSIQQNITSSSTIAIFSCDDLTLQSGFAIQSTGAGSSITLIADADNSGVGNLNLNGGNITSNNGQICLMAGPGTVGCNGSNCFSAIPGLIAGGQSSVNQTSGMVSSGAGATIVTASGNVLISGAATSIGATSGSIVITAGDTLVINEDIASTAGAITTYSAQASAVNSATLSAAGEIRMIAGTDLSLNGTAALTSAAGPITLIVDNNFPIRPFIGSGAFFMDCAAQISAGGSVRIFTALQGLNTLCAGAQINGQPIGLLGARYNDSAFERWCTYFSCPAPYPFAALGFPFTLFYKDCLQTALQQAMVIVDQILVSLHPYDEFPGFKTRFLIQHEDAGIDEPYMLRRRNLNSLNNPKSYTLLSH